MTACGATPHSSSLQPTRTAEHHVDRLPATANFAHGAEIDSRPTFMVSEGNYHVAFPPGATMVRTASGIVVTYKGVQRTFSSTARIDAGTSRTYAKASER